MALLIILLASLVVVWLVSFLVEALRRAPKAPEAMPWDPSLTPAYATVDGIRLRYVKVGEGPVLLLLHTLRTQLDLFHKVIPGLAKDFTVFALDYPGHGYSDIPDGLYDADFFVKDVNGFLEELDLIGVTVAGVSIGASISLIIPPCLQSGLSGSFPLIPMITTKEREWRGHRCWTPRRRVGRCSSRRRHRHAPAQLHHHEKHSQPAPSVIQSRYLPL